MSIRDYPPRDDAGTTRRGFLEALGGGMLVLLVTRDLPAAVGGRPRHAALEGPDAETEAARDAISAWLHIDGQDRVTVYTGKVEFGQGIRTSLAQELAEELRVPMSAITMVMGDTELTPYDMGTFGSRSTPQMGTQLRRVGATARELLIGLAAERWGVPREGLVAAEGRITGGTRGATLGYGQLVAGRQLTETVRENAALTPATAWKIAGTPVPQVGTRDLVTGRHAYTSDLRVPEMRYGRVLRPPRLGATLATIDHTAAVRVPGVTVTRDGDFAGVVAPTPEAAAQALALVRATWRPPATPGDEPASSNIYEYLKTAGERMAGGGGGEEGGRGARPFVQGDAERALAAADHRLQRTYTVAYIAHVPLEPRAAVARWTPDRGKLTVWTGTQRPFAVRDELAQAFGMPPERVRVIVPDTGSGYGGKHTGECAVEAARLARNAGTPVKLVWTREEEFRWAYFRPAGVIDVNAGAARDGRITAWIFDNYNSGPAAIRPMYAIANQRVTFHPVDSPLRQGSYRGLAATANHFAREMHVDELAEAVGMEPLAFRLRNIDDPRLRAVFQAAAERFGWDRASSSGNGRGAGIAGGFEKGGYFATAAEVEADRATGVVRVVRAVTAFDNGAVINPDGLRNQIVGAMIQGIGGALFERIDFAHGVIRNAHLAAYRVPRFSDVPEIDVVLLDRKDQPSMGAGEAPIMAIAPAIGAAIHRATGTRHRALPMMGDSG
ncbi:MAG TPA: molybdopterin cofactor-binding domain-containing protein [Gemmatimonadaceae bacterium]|nr:molybdopterin cofactor-binding domain-containing protein [Gemmatimonadaceae bacterium]